MGLDLGCHGHGVLTRMCTTSPAGKANKPSADQSMASGADG